MNSQNHVRLTDAVKQELILAITAFIRSLDSSACATFAFRRGVHKQYTSTGHETYTYTGGSELRIVVNGGAEDRYS